MGCKAVTINGEEYRVGDCVYLDPSEKQLSAHVAMTRQYEPSKKKAKQANFPPYSEKEMKKKIQEIKGNREQAYVVPEVKEGWRERLPDATRKFEDNAEKLYQLQPYVIGNLFL